MSLCKSDDCDYVYPIRANECIGDSLTAINYNFASLDNAVCEFSHQINTNWNPVLTVFGDLSAKMTEILTIVENNSACWVSTYSTVNTMSSYWLSPLTIIYPYTLAPGDDVDLTALQQWVNTYFPAKAGLCFNFIVGQELILNVGKSAAVTRYYNQQVDYPSYSYRIPLDIKPFNSIYVRNVAPNGWVGDVYVTAFCGGGGTTISVATDDRYLDKFTGIKFTLLSDFTWGNATIIYQ